MVYSHILFVHSNEGDEVSISTELFESVRMEWVANQREAVDERILQIDIKSKTDWIPFVDEQVALISKGASLPVIHFDLHGSSQGICFSDGLTLPWTDFMEALAKINSASENQLLVTMSSCESIELMYNFANTYFNIPSKPFIGFGVAIGRPTNSDAIHDFQAYFEKLVSNKEAVNFYEISRHMQANGDHRHPGGYYFDYVEEIFEGVAVGLVDDLLNFDTLCSKAVERSQYFDQKMAKTHTFLTQKSTLDSLYASTHGIGSTAREKLIQTLGFASKDIESPGTWEAIFLSYTIDSMLQEIQIYLVKHSLQSNQNVLNACRLKTDETCEDFASWIQAKG